MKVPPGDREGVNAVGQDVVGTSLMLRSVVGSIIGNIADFVTFYRFAPVAYARTGPSRVLCRSRLRKYGMRESRHLLHDSRLQAERWANARLQLVAALAGALRLENDYQGVVDLVSERVRSDQPLVEPCDWPLMVCRYWRATALAPLGRAQEALDELDDLRPCYESRFGPEGWEPLVVDVQRAHVLMLLREKERAIELLEQTLEASRRQSGEQGHLFISVSERLDLYRRAEYRDA